MHRGVAAAAFLLVACERDLAVSSPSERPVIASFSPTTTFAFALVTVTGHGFDPTAANDVVRFGNVTARRTASRPTAPASRSSCPTALPTFWTAPSR